MPDALLALVVAVVLTIGTSPVTSASVNVSCTAPPGGSCAIPFNLTINGLVTGSVEVTGTPSDVVFYVTNPSGTTIVSLGRIIGNATFSFSASIAGAYVLHFDNSGSSVQKVITVTYTVTLPAGLPEFPLQAVAMTFLTFVILGAYLLVRRTQLSRR